ncbi:hypothetical protein MSAN_01571900 [Mycena sanguinolenta]|uniref:Uncharacterized protein n=1 Tax=Mycena sanguinolenta TaxID=230812 RepID=A0A8H7CXB8_9AGAR|nr:hypothetical protein MSAN_01571900 [Mycena sanguinolenta]
MFLRHFFGRRQLCLLSHFFHVRVDSNWQEMERVSSLSPTTRLRHLLLVDSSPAKLPICDFLLHSRNLVYMHQIEHLELCIIAASASYDERILAVCAKSLKSLVINPQVLIHIPILPFVLSVEIKVFVDASRKLPAIIPQPSRKSRPHCHS